MTGAQIAKIFNDYPLATKVLVDYFEQGIKLSGNEEMDKHLGPMKRNPEVAVKIVLSMGPPRFLYDFFDDKSIGCQVRIVNGKFIGYVDQEATMLNGYAYEADKREDQENAVFDLAFAALQKQELSRQPVTLTDL